MRWLVSVVGVTASIARTVLATVCPTAHYADSDNDMQSFYNNIMVASVVDRKNVPTPLPATPLALYTELFVGTYALTSSTTPKANTYLAAHLMNGDACGQCAFKLYQGVEYIIGTDICMNGSTLNGMGVNHYSEWSTFAAAANNVSFFQNYVCISYIQPYIDQFNDCAKNGYDLRTGEYSTICTNQDDFINVDAKFGAYSIMMDHALKNNLATPIPADFAAAYTKLPCRSCFDQFMANLNNSYSVLWYTGTAGVCAGAGDAPNYAGEYYDTTAGRCLDSGSVVNGLLQDFGICAGVYNSLYVLQRFPPNADDIALFNEIIKSYQPVVVCATTWSSGPITDNLSLVANDASANPLQPYIDCLMGALANGGSSSLVPAVSGDLGCFKKLAYAVYTNESPLANTNPKCNGDTGHGPFTADCLTGLNNNSTNPDIANFVYSSADSGLVTFYKCSGFQLDVAKTTCTASEILSIGDSLKSFIPILEIALAAKSDYIAAGEKVLQNEDLPQLPCASCYARLATEFSTSLGHNDITLCENPYSVECKQSTNVVAALASFKTCSGFSLTNTSPYQCSDAEWSVLQNSHLVHDSFDLVVPNNTQTLLEALFRYSLLMTTVKSANPLMSFECDHCFRVLLSDLYVLPDADILLCDQEITTAECFSVAAIPLAKFEACSGHILEWVAEDMPTTTVAPDTTTVQPAIETTTTLMPEEPITTREPIVTTTKSSEVASLFFLTTIVSVLIAIW